MTTLVKPQFSCPDCGNDEMDELVWDAGDYVHCSYCGFVYDPLDEEEE